LEVTAASDTPSAPPTPARASVPGRLGNPWLNRLKAWFGTPSQRRLAWAALQVPVIRHWEKQFSALNDKEVRQTAAHLRGRARGGESLDRILPEMFGLTCVATLRHVGLRPFDVQLAAGIVLHRGALAEVATGEGKTLVAIMPAALNALLGKGVHVTTVNDYLALRDAEWTARVYNALGLSVGVLQQKLPNDGRTEAYQCDITYGTASEFGFDFLRDRLKVKGDSGQQVPFWAPWTTAGGQARPTDPKVQRSHHYGLVDEADNIFVDEARTPLVISTESRRATDEEAIVYRWADKLAKDMTLDRHFTLDEKKQKIELTDEGKQVIRWSNPPWGEHSHAMDKLHEHVERALHANFRFRLDQHYMISTENKIVIIDEGTGRPMPDRQWNEGLHQAVEAKEGVPITLAAKHAAQITYQSYFKLYKKLAGMTGTAMQNYWEMRRVYKLWVVALPTNRPPQRTVLPDRVFPTESAKFDAVVETVRKLREEGRPVLIGTRSVDKSELLSKRLHEAGISHQVLNAKPGVLEREADIVAQAGRPATVTIATNMAGRGTDILLGGNPETVAWSRLRAQHNFASKRDVPPDLFRQMIEQVETEERIHEQNNTVVTAGGLHVLGTERHEAARIDRQLVGRAARQGDPGSCQFFLSLEDELLEGLGPDDQEAYKQLGQNGSDRDWDLYSPEFIRAQRRVERRHYRQRLDLMNYERQRQEILKDLGADPYVD
jgi:preprotein translocase subunit SecA